MIRYHSDHDIYGKWEIRITGFSNCFEDEKNEDLFIENIDTGKKYEATISPTGICYDPGWAPKCYWGTKFVRSIIDDEEVESFGAMVRLRAKITLTENF
jgi:hypothetical protein